MLVYMDIHLLTRHEENQLTLTLGSSIKFVKVRFLFKLDWNRHLDVYKPEFPFLLEVPNMYKPLVAAEFLKPWSGRQIQHSINSKTFSNTIFGVSYCSGDSIMFLKEGVVSIFGVWLWTLWNLCWASYHGWLKIFKGLSKTKL